jgi:preprotein translocase subunit SecF
MALSGIGGRLYRGDTSVDFIGNRKRFYAFSGVLIIVAAAALGIQGLKLGIEFKGGAAFTVTAPNSTIDGANQALKDAGITSEAIVQKIGNNKIRVQTGGLANAQSDNLKANLAKNYNVQSANIDTLSIGPSWGKEITKKALYGLFGFIIVVMLYLAMAFEPKMAIAAIVAVIHDVLITVGIYALVGFDVTPATVIGFLTILGYSLYDTVVVFDKVRENTRSLTSTAKQTYSQAANLAVNQTLVRSFNTSLIALLPVASILFVGAGLLGAGTLKDLSLALFIGLAIGTYSSIFVATPILATLREREPAMIALRKRVAVRNGATGEKIVAESIPGVVTSTHSKEDRVRGPRNQPKRKSSKKH